MTVNNKSAKVSIDFVWQYEDEDGSTGFSYDIRYHHTEEFGETVSIEENGEILNLPASIFPEVSDFLRSQGVFNSETEGIQLPANSLGATALPLPSIETDEEDGGGEDEVYTPVYIPEGDPVTTFSGGPPSPKPIPRPKVVPRPSGITDEIDDGGTGQDPEERRVQHLAARGHGSIPDTPDSEKEKARQMMAQRRQAVSRAGKSGRKGLQRTAEREEIEYDETIVREEGE